ncbi:MAG: hypothetical protein H6696_11315 [Deferribacteres bacterium]|nr:hypothetical protein [candidate division KSB1 bacterium]MCB9502519.1 hypothetical protein [Deferribacteres bacterium]
MKIEHKINRLRISCPTPFDAEKILLQPDKHQMLFRAFEEHITYCPKCFRIVRKLHKFYEILDEEMQKEASPKIVAFAETVYAEKEKHH